MSSFNEFKSDAKRWGLSLILASAIIYVFKVFVFLITFGMLSLFNKIKRNKTINDNYYKI